jgi:NagD protein
VSAVTEAGLDLSAVRGWMFDVDGCLSRTASAGGENGALFEGARELVELLVAAGQRVVCCTNASGRPPSAYATGLRALGLPIADEDFLTAGGSAAHVLATRHAGGTALVLAGDGVLVPLRDEQAGVTVLDPAAPEAGAAAAVVVGASSGYTTRQFDAACRAIAAGARFYSTVKQPWFYGGREPAASATSGVAYGIGWVTGVEPEIVGKPSRAAAELVLSRLGLPAGEVVVVGDGIDAEIAMASMIGAQSIWVRTGAPAGGGTATPTVSMDSVADLLPVLQQHF